MFERVVSITAISKGIAMADFLAVSAKNYKHVEVQVLNQILVAMFLFK